MSLEPSGHVCRSKTASHVGATLERPPQLRTMWGQGSHCPHNYVQCGDEAPTAPTTTYNVGARLPLPPHFYTCNYEFFFHTRSRIDATAGKARQYRRTLIEPSFIFGHIKLAATLSCIAFVSIPVCDVYRGLIRLLESFCFGIL